MCESWLHKTLHMASLQYLGDQNLCMRLQHLMASQLNFPAGWQHSRCPVATGLQRAINRYCPQGEEVNIHSRSSSEKLEREVAIRNEDLWCAQKFHYSSADCNFGSSDLQFMIARKLALSMKIPFHLLADFKSVK